MKNCIICNNELLKTQVKYCSNKCKQKAHYIKHKTNTNSTYSQFKRADKRKKEFILYFFDVEVCYNSTS